MPVDVAAFVLRTIWPPCTLPSFFSTLLCFVFSVLKYAAREFTILFDVLLSLDTKSPSFSDTRLIRSFPLGASPAAMRADSKTLAYGLFKP